MKTIYLVTRPEDIAIEVDAVFSSHDAAVSWIEKNFTDSLYSVYPIILDYWKDKEEYLKTRKPYEVIFGNVNNYRVQTGTQDNYYDEEICLPWNNVIAIIKKITNTFNCDEDKSIYASYWHSEIHVSLFALNELDAIQNAIIVAKEWFLDPSKQKEVVQYCNEPNWMTEYIDKGCK